MPTYTSQYPPAQNDTYIKTTTRYDGDYYGHYTTDPAKSLTGVDTGNQWYSVSLAVTNQRFHIDLGSAKTIKRIYYENSHDVGENTIAGAQNFTFWGSNEATAFAELTYTTDTDWTELTVAQNTFDRHTGQDSSPDDVADPKYIVVTNSTAYRYYAFKFVDNYGNEYLLGVRRIELQTEVVPIQLTATSAITSSITSALSRGITQALTATSAITSSITSALSRGITALLTATSVITTSITSSLSRGITVALTATSAITSSLTASLSRGITQALTATIAITSSITSTLSRGITQALTSTISITTSILGRLLYDWWEEIKPTIDWTEETKSEINWTEEDKSEIDWDEEEK